MNGEYSTGDYVLKDWRLEKEIGKGSYGRVFKAVRKDEYGNTFVSAIKIITVPQSQNEVNDSMLEGSDIGSVTTYFAEMVKEIVREVALMSELKGTANIVSYEDHTVVPHIGQIGWDIIIRMELLTPLNDYVADNPLTQNGVIKLGEDLCRALELCGKHKIIHRDIKPQNIFVNENGDFKLGDFGVARTLEKTTGGLSVSGTPPYMAPEVYWEKPYNSSVDMYSLGIVLYQFLNNNRTPFLPPYPQQIRFNDRETARKKRMSGAPIPAPCNADKALAQIVLKACAYEPKNRYNSPTEMRLELESLSSSPEKTAVWPDTEEDPYGYTVVGMGGTQDKGPIGSKNNNGGGTIAVKDTKRYCCLECGRPVKQKNTLCSRCKAKKERQKKTVTILSITAVVLIIALLSITGVFSRKSAAPQSMVMLKMRERTEAEDTALDSVQTQQREEQTVAKQEGVAAIEAQYEKDMQTVREYLPGIVCWGDSITAGSTGNISYPYMLQKYIDTYICDVYNFRLSIENADEYSRLDWDVYTMDIPVINMGAGQEDTNTILGRSGVVPYVVGTDFIVPAETIPVPIVLKSSNGKDVSPLTGGSAGVNNVTINGIEGTLSIGSNSYKLYSAAQYYFVRTEPGAETSIPAGSVITTAAADMYKDYIHIICIGTFGGFESQTVSSIDNLVAQTKQMVERQVKNSDRYLVLGPCSYIGHWDGAYMNLDIVDSAMMQAFGNHYINIRKYLCEDGITDYNLKATDQDMIDAINSVVPESFRGTTGASELNDKAYELIGKLVYDRMDRLGYFDEIRGELFIEEAVKVILKDDPQYFDRLLKSGTSLLK